MMIEKKQQRSITNDIHGGTSENCNSKGISLHLWGTHKKEAVRFFGTARVIILNTQDNMNVVWNKKLIRWKVEDYS